MTDKDLANANVLNYVSECWIVIKDGWPIMALTNEQAASECAYALGGSLHPQHFKQG